MPEPLRQVITVDARPLRRGYDQAGRDVERYSRRSRKAVDGATEHFERSAGRIETAWGRVKTMLATVITAATLRFAVGGLLKLSGSLEQTRIAFSTMLGSAEAADAVLRDLYAFTASTPFEFDEVAQAGRMLLAFGSEAGELQTELRALGDIASGVGAPLTDLAQLYGKARVQGRLFAEDINQLTERGIPIIGELASQFGVAQSEVKGLVEEGRIGFPELQRAFQDLTAEGGRFAGLMEAQSDSLFGLFSTVKDQATEVLRIVGQGFFEDVKEDLRTVRDRVDELREGGGLAGWAEEASERLRGLYRVGRRVVGFLWDYGPAIARVATVLGTYMIANKAFNVVLAAGRGLFVAWRAASLLASAAAATFTGNTARATAAMTAFNTVVRLNPIGLLLSALAAGATAWALFRDRAGEAAEAQRSAAAATREALDAMRDLSGQQLFEKDQDLGARRRQAEADLETLRARRRQAQRTEYEPERVYQASTSGMGTWSTVRTADQVKQGALSAIDAEIRQREELLSGVMAQQVAVGEQITSNLNTRIGYLEAEREALVATGKESQRLTEINAELEELYRRQQQLRGDGAGGAGGGGGIDPEEARRRALLRQEAEALAMEAGTEKTVALMRVRAEREIEALRSKYAEAAPEAFAVLERGIRRATEQAVEQIRSTGGITLPLRIDIEMPDTSELPAELDVFSESLLTLAEGVEQPLDAVEAQLGAVEAAIGAAASPTQREALQQVRQDLEDLRASMRGTASDAFDLGAALESGLANSVSSLIESVASGESASKAVLETLADLAMQTGRMMIAFGISGLALKAFVSNPVGAIIAGSALVALGAAARTAISNMAQNPTASTPGGSAAGRQANASAGEPSGGGVYAPGRSADDFRPPVSSMATGARAAQAERSRRESEASQQPVFNVSAETRFEGEDLVTAVHLTEQRISDTRGSWG